MSSLKRVATAPRHSLRDSAEGDAGFARDSYGLLQGDGDVEACGVGGGGRGEPGRGEGGGGGFG
jgi:hypothetical protein